MDQELFPPGWQWTAPACTGRVPRAARLRQSIGSTSAREKMGSSTLHWRVLRTLGAFYDPRVQLYFWVPCSRSVGGLLILVPRALDGDIVKQWDEINPWKERRRIRASLLGPFELKDINWPVEGITSHTVRYFDTESERKKFSAAS